MQGTEDTSLRGSEERFKIGVVSVILCGSVIYNIYNHAESSGLPPFALTHPPYAGIVLLFASLVGFVAILLTRHTAVRVNERFKT